jgi:hypothetical protein
MDFDLRGEPYGLDEAQNAVQRDLLQTTGEDARYSGAREAGSARDLCVREALTFDGLQDCIDQVSLEDSL